MASNSVQWGCCNNEFESAGGKCMICDTCKKSYHYACLSIKESPNKTGARKSWKCPTCLSSTPRTSRNDSTPIRNITLSRANKRQATEDPSLPMPECNKEDIRSIIREIIKQECSEMLKQININIMCTINKELAPVREEIREINKSMKFINDTFEEIKMEQNLAKEKMKEIELENKQLRSTLGDLQAKTNILEQQSRKCNLEIQCVPENKKENVCTIITQLGRVVKCDIKEQDIMHCTRIAKSNTSSARPRSIIVQLATPRLRDQLLASITKFNQENPQEKLNCSHLGFAGEKFPVYVAEHLSPANRALHAAARIKAKEMHYKYVWVRDGKIFVRKIEGAEYILIKNMSSLSKII